MIMSEQYLFPFTYYIQGTRPGTRTCQEREDISAFYFVVENAGFLGTKSTPFFLKMLTFSMEVSVLFSVLEIRKNRSTVKPLI